MKTSKFLLEKLLFMDFINRSNLYVKPRAKKEISIRGNVPSEMTNTQPRFFSVNVAG